MISIVRGNDFILRIPLEQLTVREGMQNLAPFYPAGAELTVYLKHVLSRTNIPFTLSGNVLIVKIDGAKLNNGSYSIEILVVKDGRNMRSMTAKQFCIVETNAEASLPASVEFDVEIHQLQSQVFIPFGESSGTGTSDYDILGNKPCINDVELSGNKTLAELGIQPKGNYVSDPNYVHTDNNFTKTLKERLESLNNYDDTTIKKAVSKLEQALDTLVNGDVNGVIDAFSEIEAFLSGVTESDSLTKMLSDLRTDILNVIPDWAKSQEKPSYTAKEVGAMAKIVVKDWTSVDAEVEIQPNIFNRWPEMQLLTVTMAAADGYNEYMFEFHSGATPTSLTLPATVKFIGDSTIEANKTYQVSIVNNLAVIGGA